MSDDGQELLIQDNEIHTSNVSHLEVDGAEPEGRDFTGRQLMLSEPLTDEICSYVELGLGLTWAALAAGVSRNTINRWLRKAREGDERFITFMDRIDHAKAIGIAKLARTATEGLERDPTVPGSKADYKFAAEQLRRQLPEDFARNEILARGSKDVNVNVGIFQKNETIVQKDGSVDHGELRQRLAGLSREFNLQTDISDDSDD